MNSADRRERIVALLSAEGEVSVEALAARLTVTASTIRRDLTRLTTEGTVTRTYGGAVVPVGGARDEESPLHQRARKSRAEKDAIGRWAAAQVRDGETVMLDAGTTVGRTAHHLRDRQGLTVVTNGLTSLLELADADQVDVIGLGGSLRHISHGFVGSVTDMNLQRFSAHRVFLGADGLSADRGICEASPVQTRTKEIMAGQSDAVYVLADSTKVGRSPFTAWAPLQRPWTLVTDASVTEEQLAPFRELVGVTIVVVPAAEPALAPPAVPEAV